MQVAEVSRGWAWRAMQDGVRSERAKRAQVNDWRGGRSHSCFMSFSIADAAIRVWCCSTWICCDDTRKYSVVRPPWMGDQSGAWRSIYWHCRWCVHKVTPSSYLWWLRYMFKSWCRIAEIFIRAPPPVVIFIWYDHVECDCTCLFGRRCEFA